LTRIKDREGKLLLERKREIKELLPLRASMTPTFGSQEKRGDFD
jgi:hypothetical protein